MSFSSLFRSSLLFSSLFLFTNAFFLNTPPSSPSSSSSSSSSPLPISSPSLPSISSISSPSLPSISSISPISPFLPSLSPSSISSTLLRLSSNDIKNGMAIEVDGVPMRVLEFLHVKPGKGSAFVRSKLKNLITGGNVDKTFRAGEPLDQADVMKTEFQYSYSDDDNHFVMDMESYEVEGVPLNTVSNAEFLVEGMMVNVLKWNDKPIDVELPANYNFVVEYTEEGDKGNTAQGGGSKPATLDCGATVMVPLFIKQGETIKVDLKEKKYLSRVN